MAREYAARNKRPSGGGNRNRGGKSSGGVPGWVWMIAGLSVGLSVAAFVFISRPTAQPLRGTAAVHDTAGARDGEAPPSRADKNADDRRKPATARSDARKADSTKGGKESVEIPPREKPRFTFYELLPSQEVLVTPQESPPPRPQAARPVAPTAEATPAPVPSAATIGVPPPAAVTPAPVPNAPAVAKPAAPAPAPSGEAYIIQIASYRDQAQAEKQKASLALLGVQARVEKITIDNRDTYYRVRVGPERDFKRAQALVSQLEGNGIKAMMVKVNY